MAWRLRLPEVRAIAGVMGRSLMAGTARGLRQADVDLNAAARFRPQATPLTVWFTACWMFEQYVTNQ